MLSKKNFKRIGQEYWEKTDFSSETDWNTENTEF